MTHAPHPLKAKCVLLSYWLLFILLPTFMLSFPFRGTPLMLLTALICLLLFVVIGIRGYPEWRRLWKV